jgi:glucosyl-dolichyl phosphate glucuronosyltransferase
MTVSVIIPTYKRPEFLQQTLKSLQEQTLPDFEIVVVDNAVQPEVEETLAGFNLTARRTARYVPERSPGLHWARHAGARAARGDILVYIDDDVICPPKWLQGMVEPYQNPLVGMVAGRVELLFESEPPAWLNQFRGILSALEWQQEAQALPPYGTPVGCNMSIRKSLLFAVQGFNPDGFGERRLLRWRGDGECGLTRKVHDAGRLVWMAPEAWLYHRVPASRMTLKYIYWRHAIGGIEEAYVDLRYNRRTVPGLGLQGARAAVFFLYHLICAQLQRRNKIRQIHHFAMARRYQHRACQHWRQSISGDLRRYTRQSSYLDCREIPRA